MDDELKPCPFCGKPPAAGIVGVSCVRCHPDDGLGFVARTWETRPIEDALRVEVERLKAELAKYTEPLTDEQANRAHKKFSFFAYHEYPRLNPSFDNIDRAVVWAMDAATREVRSK